jgi:hypothetical protein
VKRIGLLALASLFFYCLFRDMNLVKTLILCAAIVSAYAISRIPAKYLLGSKYPVIGVSLALPVLLIMYPATRAFQMVAAGALLVGFYSIALFLVTMAEKGKELYLEVTGLSILYAALGINLFLTGHSELILPLSIAILLFLFINNRMKVMPFVAGYALAAIILVNMNGGSIFGHTVPLLAVERYALLGCAAALLLATFIAYVKKTDLIGVLAFFGLLYISVDLLMSVGFRLKGILLYQPVLALFVVGPVLGMAMKGGKERR